MPDSRHSIVVGTPPEKIQPLISSASGFAQWWAADAHEAPASCSSSRPTAGAPCCAFPRRMAVGFRLLRLLQHHLG
jgi:hypothetical protein